MNSNKRPSGFAILGDTQRTLFFEKFLLFREQNDSERVEILKAVVDQKPEFLIHLGDMVDWGTDSKAWESFDQLVLPLKKAGIELFPIIGNHEYFGFSSKKTDHHLTKRFDCLKSMGGYQKEYQNLGLIFLNSNKKFLSGSVWNAQLEWMRKALIDFELRSDIQGVLVFGHHPAFTNSKVTGDEPAVVKDFLPLIMSSKKVQAYFCGHVHAYEHFIENQKHFIVCGGGGGPRVGLHQGGAARHIDRFVGSVPRPFHFLWLESSYDGIKIVVNGLEKGQKSENIRVIDQILIPFSI